MNPGQRVVIDEVRGEARLGATSVLIAAAEPAGSLQVGGPEGPVLRPITFGERTRLVSRALSSSRPRASVSSGVLRAATVRPGVADRVVREILALALAGAELAAPSFAEAALLVARSSGWDFAQLAGAEATEIDRLAIHVAGTQQPRSQWNRLVLLGEPPDEMQAIRAELADALLGRADGSASAAEVSGHEAGSLEQPAGVSSAGAREHPGGAPAGMPGGARPGEFERPSEAETSAKPDRKLSWPGPGGSGYDGPGSLQARPNLESGRSTVALTGRLARVEGTRPRLQAGSQTLRILRADDAGAASGAGSSAPWPGVKGPPQAPRASSAASADRLVAPSQSAAEVEAGWLQADHQEGVGQQNAGSPLPDDGFRTAMVPARPQAAWGASEAGAGWWQAETPLLAEAGSRSLPELVEALAAMLHEEADMRGIER